MTDSIHSRAWRPLALALLGLCGLPDSAAALPAAASAPAVTASSPREALARTAEEKKAARLAEAKRPKIDVNSASRAELKTLPGIGDAEAERIVAHRPYLSKGDLTTKKVIPAGVFLSIKNRIVAIQKGPAPRGQKGLTAQGKNP